MDTPPKEKQQSFKHTCFVAAGKSGPFSSIFRVHERQVVGGCWCVINKVNGYQLRITTYLVM